MWPPSPGKDEHGQWKHETTVCRPVQSRFGRCTPAMTRRRLGVEVFLMPSRDDAEQAADHHNSVHSATDLSRNEPAQTYACINPA